MSSLADLRTEIRDALTAAGLPAKEYVAEAIVPPVCIVVPAEPYVTAGERFGEHNVGIQVLIIASKGTNKASADKVDASIEQVIVALDDFDVTEVAQPGEVSLKGTTYMAALVTIQREIKFNKEAI